MSTTSVIRERHEAAARGKAALAHLHDHPDTTCGQLGAARDLLNLIYRWNDAGVIWDAVVGLETIVTTVYGGPPTNAVTSNTQCSNPTN